MGVMFARPETVREFIRACKGKIDRLFFRVIEEHVELDINQRNWFKESAFHFAANHAKFEMMDILLVSGADVNLPGPEGYTPLDMVMW
jgi:ankyrin repeat protein